MLLSGASMRDLGIALTTCSEGDDVVEWDSIVLHTTSPTWWLCYG